jgi:hypothetical protein
VPPAIKGVTVKKKLPKLEQATIASMFNLIAALLNILFRR